MNSIHLENLLKVPVAGARILPVMPGFYHKPTTLKDIIDFVVGKTLDALDVPHTLFARWGDRRKDA